MSYTIEELRAAAAAGQRIQANRGTPEAPNWVTLADPQFTCEAHLYRVEPLCEFLRSSMGNTGDRPPRGRQIAIDIACRHAKLKPESYYAEPFQPHEWVVDAIEHVLKDAWMLGDLFHDKVTAEQSAVIEWLHGKGAEAGMRWIANGLWGPGFLPDAEAPWGTDAQAWFDANRAEPLPVCACGRPSNTFGQGIAACSIEHFNAAAPASDRGSDS